MSWDAGGPRLGRPGESLRALQAGARGRAGTGACVAPSLLARWPAFSEPSPGWPRNASSLPVSAPGRGLQRCIATGSAQVRASLPLRLLRERHRAPAKTDLLLELERAASGGGFSEGPWPSRGKAASAASACRPAEHRTLRKSPGASSLASCCGPICLRPRVFRWVAAGSPRLWRQMSGSTCGLELRAPSSEARGRRLRGGVTAARRRRPWRGHTLRDRRRLGPERTPVGPWTDAAEDGPAAARC